MNWFPCCGGGGSGPGPCQSLCADNNAPDNLTVAISGIEGDGGLFGGPCDVLDGTYLLPFEGGVSCQWGTPHGQDPCNFSQPMSISAFLQLDGSDYVLYVFIATFSSSSGMQFKKNFGTTPPDCTAWVDVDIPYDQSFGSNCCDGTNATMEVTSGP